MVEQPVQEELQAEQEKENIMDKYAESTWFADIVHFLLYLQCPEHLDKKAVRSLKLKATKYCLIEQKLFWKDPGGIFLRCLDNQRLRR